MSLASASALADNRLRWMRVGAGRFSRTCT
jgi:hypothetical protein